MEFPKIKPIPNASTTKMTTAVINCALIATNRRLTLDIISLHDEVRYHGDDDGDYYRFTASNGYEIISRSRMDIQTERIWLTGGQPNERSGSMVFSSNRKRDIALDSFLAALREWITFVSPAPAYELHHKIEVIKRAEGVPYD